MRTVCFFYKLKNNILYWVMGICGLVAIQIPKTRFLTWSEAAFMQCRYQILDFRKSPICKVIICNLIMWLQVAFGLKIQKLVIRGQKHFPQCKFSLESFIPMTFSTQKYRSLLYNLLIVYSYAVDALLLKISTAAVFHQCLQMDHNHFD